MLLTIFVRTFTVRTFFLRTLFRYLSEQVLLEFVILDEPTSPELPDFSIEMLLLTSRHPLSLNRVLQKKQVQTGF